MAVEKIKRGLSKRLPFRFNVGSRRRRKSFRFRFRFRGGIFFKKRKRSLYRRRKKARIFNFHTPLSRNIFIKLSPLFRYFNTSLVEPTPASRISYRTESFLIKHVFLRYPYKFWGSRVGGFNGTEAVRQFGLSGMLDSFNQSFRVLSINRKAGLKLSSGFNKGCLFSLLQNTGWVSYPSKFTSFLKLIFNVLPNFTNLVSPLVIQVNNRLVTFKSIVSTIKKGKVSFKNCGGSLLNGISYLFYSLFGWLNWWRVFKLSLEYLKQKNKNSLKCQLFVN